MVNEWRSAGAIRVPGSAAGACIEPLERRAAHLFEYRGSPVALEIAFEGPIPHWWGVPVSVPEGAGYRLDPQLLRAAIVDPTQLHVTSSRRRG